MRIVVLHLLKYCKIFVYVAEESTEVVIYSAKHHYYQSELYEYSIWWKIHYIGQLKISIIYSETLSMKFDKTTNTFLIGNVLELLTW